MSDFQMKELVIGDKIASMPIIQGGMGIGISMSKLAAAVANEGGIGVISAAGVGMFEKVSNDFNQNNIAVLRSEIRKAKQMTNGLLGVNIMVALSNFEDLARASMEEEIDFIFAGAGLPLNLPGYLPTHSKTKLVPIISSARAAKLITQKWLRAFGYLPDAFVLEGPKAGGHLGFKYDQLEKEEFQLEQVLPQVLEILQPFEKEHNKKIPVIVGGGVYTGEDVDLFLSMGADAVQMATRFVTTNECDASDAFKQTYIDAKEEDIVYISSPVGLPGRAIKNDYLMQVEKGLKHPFTCPYNCIITCKKEKAPYCITLALVNAKNGKLKNGFAFAGVNAFKAKAIVSVKEVFTKIKEEYHNCKKKKLVSNY
jgi:nitronate monooxygenase